VLAPIYLKLPRESIRDKVVVDLKPYNIVVKGDFLVTLEHIKNLRSGGLYFYARLGKNIL